MNKLQTNVNDIKSVAKILKKELANMSFDISHSSALNLASRSLGFKNYQTYQGLNENKNLENNALNIMTFGELKAKVEKEKLENYPRIYNQFVKIGHTQVHDIYIDRELSEDVYNYFLLFELKESYTGRVFFSPKYDTFSLFVYPEVKNPNSSYDFGIKGGSDGYFRMIKHINQKKWMTKELLDDLMDLMERVKKDRKALLDITNNHSHEKLEELYIERKND